MRTPRARPSTTTLDVALLLALAACGGTPPRPTPIPPPEDVPDPDAEIHALNARARQGGVAESIHGTRVEDPFRALERDDELTQSWIAAQNARTEAALPVAPSATARLAELMAIGAISDVMVGGDAIFFSRRDARSEQPILYVREGEQTRALLDPASLGERAAIDWYYPSPDGSLLAFGASENGDEKSTLQILDVRNGEIRELRIPRTKWCNLAWLPDSRGFYYTRYPAPGDEGYDAEQEDHYFPRVFFHALGEDPEDDPRVFGGDRGTDFPAPDVSADGRWLVVNLHRGWSESDVHVFDRGPRGTRNVPTERQPMKPVIVGATSLTTGTVDDGVLYLRTNDGAPRSRLMTTDPRHPSPTAQWRELVPERAAPLEHWALFEGGIAAHYIDDIRSKLVLFDREGNELREVVLPARGAIHGLASTADGDTIAFGFEGYLQPPSLLRFDGAQGAVEEVERVETDIPFARYETRQVRVASADGTEVPVTLLQRRDLEPRGDAPVLLYGYGGFNISLLPAFSRTAIYWLERGGVYAVANTRGGGELGEDWHRAGMLEQKRHVFEDFEAVISWLSESGLSRPDRIALTGGSNGGLLMGAMITRVPERFAAAAAYVGLYDMVRYHRFPPAELWVSEYGSADDADQFPFLFAYSPYHHVERGTAYPAVLIESADHDSRVHWAHSTKFAAALQEATSADAPVLFYLEREQGHSGARRSDQVARYGRMFTFFEERLGMQRQPSVQ